MIEIRKQPFLENLCVLLICHDAQIDDFTEHLTSLYDPCVDTVYVCADKTLDFMTRAKMLRQIRDVFADADIRIRNVTAAQIRILGVLYLWSLRWPDTRFSNIFTDKNPMGLLG